MRRALVLSGGGAKGAFQVGVIEHLVCKRELDFHIFCGVSVGSLTAGYLAQAPARPPGRSLESLGEQVLKLVSLWTERIRGSSDIYRRRFLGILAALIGADGLYNPAPLRQLMERNLSAEAIRTSGRVLKIGVVSLLDGSYRVLTSGKSDPDRGEIAMAGLDDQSIVDYIQASTAIPFVFPPVRIGNDILVDGGVRNITPLASAFRERPDEIHVIYTGPGGRRVPREFPEEYREGFLGTKVSAMKILRRTTTILTDEIYNDDVEGARAWNAIAEGWGRLVESLPEGAKRRAAFRKFNRLVRQRAGIRLVEYYPERFYGENDSATDFDPEAIEAYRRHGLAVAEKYPDGNPPERAGT